MDKVDLNIHISILMKQTEFNICIEKMVINNVKKLKEQGVLTRLARHQYFVYYAKLIRFWASRLLMRGKNIEDLNEVHKYVYQRQFWR